MACTTCGGMTAYGVQALAAATTGQSNTAFGRIAASGVSTGQLNTAVGMASLNGVGGGTGLTSGSRNTGVGEGSGGALILGGSDNTFIGAVTANGTSFANFNGTCTLGSNVITTASTPAGIANGQSIASAACLIPSGTTVSSFVANTSVTISQNAGAAATTQKVYVSLNPCDNCTFATVIGDGANMKTFNSANETILGAQAVGNGTSTVTLGRTADVVYVAGGLLATNTLYSAAGTPLPTCNAGSNGTKSVVSDATTPTYLGAYASGGAVVAPVVCNGSGWVTY